jgi:hypothetical protein
MALTEYENIEGARHYKLRAESMDDVLLLIG